MKSRKLNLMLPLLSLLAPCVAAIPASAEQAPSLKCLVQKGMYQRATTLREWNSSVDANPFPQFKYYGHYQDESVDLIWGVNIGASVPKESRDRFQIFGAVKQNGVFTEVSVKADTDSRRPIDLALYVPISDVSVICQN